MFEMLVSGVDLASTLMRKLRQNGTEIVIEGIYGPHYRGHSFCLESAKTSPRVTIKLPPDRMEQGRMTHIRQRILDSVRAIEMPERLEVVFVPLEANGTCH